MCHIRCGRVGLNSRIPIHLSHQYKGELSVNLESENMDTHSSCDDKPKSTEKKKKSSVYSRILTPASRCALSKIFCEHLLEIAKKYDLLPGELLFTGNKLRNVVAARRELLTRMIEGVFIDPRRNEVYTGLYMEGGKQLSYPIIAKLFGFKDHTGPMRMYKGE